MTQKMYMHETTFRYLRDHPDVLQCKQQVMISGYDFGFNGIEIVIANDLSPTIQEYPKGSWIFPKERFTIYEPSDEEWCRYFKIGYEARGFIMGEVMGVEENFFSTTPKKNSTAFTLERMQYKQRKRYDSRGYPL